MGFEKFEESKHKETQQKRKVYHWNNEECSICQENLVQPPNLVQPYDVDGVSYVRTNCGHYFHSFCVFFSSFHKVFDEGDLLAFNHSCPLCRSNLSSVNIRQHVQDTPVNCSYQEFLVKFSQVNKSDYL